MRTKVRLLAGDRGSFALEVAILGPALFLLVFASIQLGLVAYAKSLALGAAQEGATAVRALGASAATGRARAQSFLDASAGDSLLDTNVSVSRSQQAIRVEVTGRSLSVLPGFHGVVVTQHAEAPVERFTTDTRA